METHSHDSICEVEGLLDSISVVNINVKIHHSSMIFQQFEDSQNDIIGVAESTGLALLGMMETSSPVYCDAGISSQEGLGCIDGPSHAHLAEFVEPCEAGTIACFVHGKLALEFIGVDVKPSFFFSFEHHIIVFHEPLAGEYIFADEVLEVVDVLRVMELQKL